MNLADKRLVYRSRIAQERVVKHNILEVEDMQMYDVMLRVQAKGGKVSTPTQRVQFRRHYYLHLDRRTGNVYYFRPQCEDFSFFPGEHKIHVGVQGEFE